MNASIKRVTIASLLCLGIAACSSDDDDASDMTAGNGTNLDGSTMTDGTGTDNSGSTSGPAPGTVPAEVVTAFDGTWVSNCSQQVSITGEEHQRATLVISGDTYLSTVNSYTDSDCSVAAFPATAVSDFSMQFPEGEVTTSQGPAAFVDITMETLVVDGVDLFSAQQALGNVVQYNIIVVGVDGRLYFGVPNTSESARPTTLQTDVYFELQ